MECFAKSSTMGPMAAACLLAGNDAVGRNVEAEEQPCGNFFGEGKILLLCRRKRSCTNGVCA